MVCSAGGGEIGDVEPPIVVEVVVVVIMVEGGVVIDADPVALGLPGMWRSLFRCPHGLNEVSLHVEH